MTAHSAVKIMKREILQDLSQNLESVVRGFNGLTEIMIRVSNEESQELRADNRKLEAAARHSEEYANKYKNDCYHLERQLENAEETIISLLHPKYESE